VAGQQPAPQRAWRAACPNCGAPVDFRSAASASAVCSFCRSTLVRDGDALRRIGQSAELFDDHSPLQLGVTGRAQDVTFTLIGRLQYAYDGGTWNEWHALFDNARSAWLSEDNGAYVLSFDADLLGPPPPAAEVHAGQRLTLGGSTWDVASVVQARVLAAQGELPRPPAGADEFTVVDLRNMLGEVATLDYSDPAAVQFSLGRATTLEGLALQGLKDSSEKTLTGRALNCPNCGASVEPKLQATLSLSCPQCHSVIDLSQGAAGDLAHHTQSATNPSGRAPKIPLGSTGRLAIGEAEPLDWQCVGYLDRCDIPDDDGEPPTPWGEYLLYHRTAGFAFLVDGEDGWSAVRPLTGAPEVRGQRATWQGATYTQTFRYAAKVTWVEGEFYWRVQRDEVATVTDYVGTGAAQGQQLSREETGQEVTWSHGRQLPAGEVAAAFKLAPDQQPRLGSDVRPTSSGAGGLKTVLILLAVIVLVMLLMSRCGSRNDCDRVASSFGADSAEYRQCLQARNTGGRTRGGSFGGYSGGGGHK
jgi:Zn finger protein HypA/HybF involved in hydrogenase expression